ncbi:hypothetical protein ABZP36_021441 [Zizania latifolia]
MAAVEWPGAGKMDWTTSTPAAGQATATAIGIAWHHPDPSHGGGCSFLLLAAAAFLAACGLAAAALGAAVGEHVLLNVEDMVAGPSSSSSSSCHDTPREHKHGAASGTRMTIVHRLGPCSSLADAHGKPPSHEEILAADQSRAVSIQHRVSATTAIGRGTTKLKGAAAAIHHTRSSSHHGRPWSPVPPASLSSSCAPSLPVSSGQALGTGNYLVTIGLGTPTSRYTVEFDTGSDTTWVQCQPCVVACYKQKDKLFDPAKSSTYAKISCASSYCSDLIDSKGCSGGHCLYAVQYGDGSYTVGFFAQDTLTGSLSPPTTPSSYMQATIYPIASTHAEDKYTCTLMQHICMPQILEPPLAASHTPYARLKPLCLCASHALPLHFYRHHTHCNKLISYTRGLFGEAAGLLGLGRGRTSLPVQTYDRYGGLFEHCIPASSTGTGYLDFGPGSPEANARLTPMLTENGPYFYYVGMTGIRVGGQLLPIPQSVFSTRPARWWTPAR